MLQYHVKCGPLHPQSFIKIFMVHWSSLTICKSQHNAIIFEIFLLFLASFLCSPGFSYAQQVVTIDLPVAQAAPPAVLTLVRRPEREQRELYIEKTSRIRTHHRAVPLQNSQQPFSTTVRNPPTKITERTQQAMLENNLNVFRKVSITKSAELDYYWASPISEPTVAARGNEILATGNWYAAFSLNGGESFKLIDPFSMFKKQNPASISPLDTSPLALPNQDGTNKIPVATAQDTIPNNTSSQSNFCCDQIASYDKQSDAMFWLMQGVADEKGNLFRLLVAKGTADIRDNNWFYYDLASTELLQETGKWFDFPDVAFSDKHIYISTNIFTIGSNEHSGSMIIRIDKHALASYQKTIASAVYVPTGSLRLVHGASDKMYWGGHFSQEMINIWRWSDNDSALAGPTTLKVERWEFPNEKNTKIAFAPNKRPWLNRADGRITAGWKAGQLLGFAWTAGADNRFKFPHVRVAVADQAKVEQSFGPGRVSPTAEPHIWSNSFGIAYPAASPNSDGDVGVIVTFGGPKHFPSQAIGVFPKNLSEPFRLTQATNGLNTPICPKQNNEKDFNCGVWGDYFTVRPHGVESNTWVTVGYTMQNSDKQAVKAESEFLQFRIKK